MIDSIICLCFCLILLLGNENGEEPDKTKAVQVRAPWIFFFLFFKQLINLRSIPWISSSRATDLWLIIIIYYDLKWIMTTGSKWSKSTGKRNKNHCCQRSKPPWSTQRRRTADRLRRYMCLFAYFYLLF